MTSALTSAQKPAPVLADANISYEVQWQALAAAERPLRPAARQIGQRRAPASTWELHCKGNGAPVLRRSLHNGSKKISAIEGLRKSGLHAQRHLSTLQVTHLCILHFSPALNSSKTLPSEHRAICIFFCSTPRDDSSGQSVQGSDKSY